MYLFFFLCANFGICVTAFGPVLGPSETDVNTSSYEDFISFICIIIFAIVLHSAVQFRLPWHVPRTTPVDMHWSSYSMLPEPDQRELNWTDNAGNHVCLSLLDWFGCLLDWFSGPLVVWLAWCIRLRARALFSEATISIPVPWRLKQQLSLKQSSSFVAPKKSTSG